AFAAVLLAGTALGGIGASFRPAAAEDAIPAAPIVAQAGATLPGFGDLVARVRPAVVTITSTERVQAEQASSPFPQGSEQDQTFRHFFGGNTPNNESRLAKALGSGFIVDADGHVVTNNHVVDGATKVVVTLDDGRELDARVVGRDPRTDIAVLKVDAGGKLPFLALGDSDKARPGDWVVAMGNPFGLGGSVTAGIVSARGRDIGAGPYDDFLQIDAPINRGNSGGPLFGTDGTVVGVNTAIFSPSGGSVGIGFAIPSNLVKQVVAELEEHGHLDRGYLGVMTQKLNPEMATALKLAHPTGALVAEVEPNAPAAKAGLKPGDVITAVNGTPVSDPRALARQVAALRPGSTATVAVQRDGAEQTLKMTAASLPEKTADASVPGEPSGGAKLGLALAPINPAARESLGLGDDVKGAVIAAVRPGSPASEAGLKPGDVLLSVGNKQVATPEDAVQAIRAQQASKQHAVALRVLRDGHSLFVAVPSAQG
ncbi:MAG: serine protease Do, partial [Cryptosporangiaceae bacterium]|nr:serine protease Do [Cryptosporangiaceae bacterium]